MFYLFTELLLFFVECSMLTSLSHIQLNFEWKPIFNFSQYSIELIKPESALATDDKKVRFNSQLFISIVSVLLSLHCQLTE